jgi:hypothetical protein
VLGEAGVRPVPAVQPEAGRAYCLGVSLHCLCSVSSNQTAVPLLSGFFQSRGGPIEGRPIGAMSSTLRVADVADSQCVLSIARLTIARSLGRCCSALNEPKLISARRD